MIKDKDFVFSRIGMALISAQRVEYIADEIVRYLNEHDRSFYRLTTEDFMSTSTKAVKSKMTLGKIFKLLKLNEKLVIDEELDSYLNKRNILSHHLWKDYLSGISRKQEHEVIDFCYDFGRHSDRMESFFKGFLFFLQLRFVVDRDHMPDHMKKWDKDFDYFMQSLREKRLSQENISITRCSSLVIHP